MKVTVTIEVEDSDVKDLFQKLIAETSWAFLKNISDK